MAKRGLAVVKEIGSDPRAEKAPLRGGPQRLIALDAFRGMAIAGMILVNSPGAASHRYAALRHAEWNGWTPADLIFPSFLFIVGVATTLSIQGALRAGASRRAMLFKLLRRVALIFALGLLLNAFPLFDWATLRIPGVLQRIALCYGIAAILVLTTRPIDQVVVGLVLLVGYWLTLMLVPVPGGVAGALLPETNLAAWIDRQLLPHHLLHPGWDPEGVLSTLPAIATTLAGALTGHWLRWPRNQLERATGMLAAGNLAMFAGLVWGAAFPINKSLWTSSFAVFSAGVALVILGLCTWLIDLKRFRAWAKPFVIYGSNPLLAYVLSSWVDKALMTWVVTRDDGSRVVMKQLIYSSFFLRFLSGPHASFAYALIYVLLWLVPLTFLYRKRIFVRI
jgi:predicted acyltransferase